MKEEMVTVDVSKKNFAKKLDQKCVKIKGELTMPVLYQLERHEYDLIDISEVSHGIGYEEHWVTLGFSHHGAVERCSWHKVEVLRKFLEIINAKCIVLPDNVMRRHINSAWFNKDIKELRVNDSCPLFAYEDGKLMNKKKTSVVFARQ